MKNIIIIIALFIITVSCSTNQCIEAYMYEEIKINKTKNINSVLLDKKVFVTNTLETYRGIKIHNINSQAKSFSQDDYDRLYEKHKNDSIAQYWNQCDAKRFNFSSMITVKSLNERVMPKADSIIYLYQISKPLFIKNKKHALFSVFISRGPGWIIDDYVIIMKKERRKWVFLEKVHSENLH